MRLLKVKGKEIVVRSKILITTLHVSIPDKSFSCLRCETMSQSIRYMGMLSLTKVPKGYEDHSIITFMYEPI